jgi:hypothetical protein
LWITANAGKQEERGPGFVNRWPNLYFDESDHVGAAGDDIDFAALDSVPASDSP